MDRLIEKKIIFRFIFPRNTYKTYSSNRLKTNKKLFVMQKRICQTFILALNQCNHSIVQSDDDVWLECKIHDMDRMGWHSVIDAYLLLAYIFRMDFHSLANGDGCDDDKMVQNYCCHPNMAEQWYEVKCVMDFGQSNDSETVSTKKLYLLLNCNWFEPPIPCLQNTCKS